MRKLLLACTSTLLMPALLLARKEKIDVAAVDKIKNEGTTNSKVMDIAFHLTDVSGSRLTVSPGFKRAANWAKDQLASYGLSNARMENWGEFGKGWEQQKCYIAMTEPYYVPFIAQPKVWTGSTPGKGIFKGEVVVIKASDSTTLVNTYGGKLKGKIVMMYMKDTLKPSFVADGERYADTILDKMAKAEPVIRNNPDLPLGNNMAGRFRAMQQQRRVAELINNEEPALVLSMSARGNDGTIFVQGGGAYARDSKETPASLVLSSDDYLRVQRLAEAGIPVKLETEVRTRFYTDDMNGYNVIAEFPGTDPALKDEVVMMGAHLDSWQGATGATDNAAGCAVMMEAIRLLKASGIQPRRTIRIALWSGEEQGLLGSRAWVKQNLADPADMVLKPDHSKIAAYFNLDNGTGRIRGIYCQSNKDVKPIFQEWLTPFESMDAKTVTISNTGGTDHQSFDAVGIPGFQFIQDEIEYNTRTHHTNMDTYDHLVPEDLKQASVIVATFVYNAAQRDEKLPRKELPKPRPAGGRGM